VFFYRPPDDALQDQNDTPNEHYYCWLIWEWSNLFPACESCMTSKGTVFPVANKRATLGVRKADTLRQEKPFLLDPCNDDPEQHLEFHENGRVTAKTEQGEKTIEILSLNRERLQAERKAEASVLKQVWTEELRKASRSSAGEDEILQVVNQAMQAYRRDDQPFAGMKRQLLEHWSKTFHTDDIEPLPPDEPPKPPNGESNDGTLNQSILELTKLLKELRDTLPNRNGDLEQILHELHEIRALSVEQGRPIDGDSLQEFLKSLKAFEFPLTIPGMDQPISINPGVIIQAIQKVSIALAQRMRQKTKHKDVEIIKSLKNQD